MHDHLMNTYRPLSVSFERGEGAWLWDTQGNKYLDAVSGVAVCGLGHAHPAVTQAICQQAASLLHTSNLYKIDQQVELATRLSRLARLDRAFFCNSGAEANEAAIKLARLFGHRQGYELPQIVVMEGSFHGRTLATLTATGNRKVQAGFEPLVKGFIRAPYNDLETLRHIAAQSNQVVAVLLEPILGEGGIVIPDKHYLAGVRDLCDEHGWLMMTDEIQTGMCRTGRWFATQHAEVVPDVMTLAKGLANGVPIGACLAHGAAAEIFIPGNHGSTFGGNPLACRAALAVLEVLETEHLAQRAQELGERMLNGLRAALGSNESVQDIRGKGLMLAVELERSCQVLMERALARGLLINVTAERVIRLLPPLILSDIEADQIVAMVSQLVLDFDMLQ